MNSCLRVSNGGPFKFMNQCKFINSTYEVAIKSLPILISEFLYVIEINKILKITHFNKN